MQQLKYEQIYEHEYRHWWYRNRRMLIADILHHYHVPQGVHIADVGCGTGLLIKDLSVLGYKNIVGFDNSPIAVEFCKKRDISGIFLSGVERISATSASFDVVLLLDVLEHVRDEDLAISEIRRILKPDGILIVTVPAFKFLWGINDILSQHHRRYTLTALRKLFLRNDEFVALHATYFNAFLFLPTVLFRLAAHIFPISEKDEVNLRMNKNSLMNAFFYTIFACERKLLRFISFPFGTSCLLILKNSKL